MTTKPSRNVRVSDELWDAAGREAVRRGESVAAAINRFLADYASFEQIPQAPAQTVNAVARRQQQTRSKRKAS